MFNQVIAYGRLVANPELRQTQNSVICSFTIAVDRPKSKDGNQTADFIKCTCWNKIADMVSKYFNKSKPIMVTGRLQNNDYIDKNGTKHYSYVVLVSNVSFSINDNSQNRAVESPQAYTQGNYTPNYQNSSQTKYVGMPKSYPPLPSEDVNFSNFEEILSDDSVPF